MRVDFRTIFIAAVALSAASCSTYNKVLKSKDSDLKYRTAIEYYRTGKYSKALALFQDIAHIYSQSARADPMAYYTGATLYKMGDLQSSCELFDGFRQRFGRSPFLEDVEYMYANGFYLLSPGPERDQAATHQALRAIGEYLDRYPNSIKKDTLLNRMIELRQKLWDKSYLNAKLYYDIGYYTAAVTALENAIEEFPESNHREELSFLVLKAHYQYARNSVERLQRQRYLDTQDAYYNFMEEYPESRYAKEAAKMFAEAKDYLDKYNARHPLGSSENSNQSDNSETQDGNQKK